MNSEKLQTILQESAADHDHICPRQILGARLGLAGLTALGFRDPPTQKRLIVITETDGCFVDGLSAATKCAVGHRTLRVHDFGKTAATFVDTQIGKAVRVSPALDIREKVDVYSPNHSYHYLAQLQAYQIMPDPEMFNMVQVILRQSIEEIVSRPGMRAICKTCGEEIMNEREVREDGSSLCLSCAGESYYSLLSTCEPKISIGLKAASN